ncbi:MAG: protein phosphatase 2C domain-containing protein [Oscillospiraceae bacterium]
MKNYKSFNLTVRGANHYRNGILCQDSSYSLNKSTYTVTIVCDGHGGSDYCRSHIGAYMAKEAAAKCITNSELIERLKSVTNEKEENRIIFQLEKSIISEWNDLISEHFSKNPFTDDELENVSDDMAELYRQGNYVEMAYGTTLIAVLVTEQYWFCVHIGDGKCIILEEKKGFSQPVPWDERCFLNTTTSLCDIDALNGFRYYFSRNLPDAVFIACDGVDNSFADENALYNFYSLISESFKIMPFENAVCELAEYLPVLSENGSGDDISVAGIINTDIFYFDKMKQNMQDY